MSETLVVYSENPLSCNVCCFRQLKFENSSDKLSRAWQRNGKLWNNNNNWNTVFTKSKRFIYITQQSCITSSQGCQVNLHPWSHTVQISYHAVPFGNILLAININFALLVTTRKVRDPRWARTVQNLQPSHFSSVLTEPCLQPYTVPYNV